MQVSVYILSVCLFITVPKCLESDKKINNLVVIEMLPKFQFQICLCSRHSMNTYGSLTIFSFKATENTCHDFAENSSCIREAAVLWLMWIEDCRHPYAAKTSFFFPKMHTCTYVQVHSMHSIIPWRMLLFSMFWRITFVSTSQRQWIQDYCIKIDILIWAYCERSGWINQLVFSYCCLSKVLRWPNH